MSSFSEPRLRPRCFFFSRPLQERAAGPPSPHSRPSILSLSLHTHTQDLSYEVRHSARRRETIKLLDGVSGYLLPGQLSALVRGFLGGRGERRSGGLTTALHPLRSIQPSLPPVPLSHTPSPSHNRWAPPAAARPPSWTAWPAASLSARSSCVGCFWSETEQSSRFSLANLPSSHLTTSPSLPLSLTFRAPSASPAMPPPALSCAGSRGMWNRTTRSSPT